MIIRLLTLCALLLTYSTQCLSSQLLRTPTLSGDTLVFAYANDIWKVGLQGGNATRLTSFQGLEREPKLSPDGKWIAFTGEYAGNTDVYMISINGGDIKRLTYHPGADRAVGWSPDGKNVLFNSTRSNAPRGWERLYYISTAGGNPTRLPMNRALSGSFSPDADKLVYRRSGFWDRGWRNYRGGQNQALRIIDLDTLDESDLPFGNDFEIEPVWQGEDIYYLSNRSEVANVVKYSSRTKQVSAVTQLNDYDVMSFAIDGDKLVFEYLGDLYLQVGNAAARKLDISVTGDFYWLREQYVDASNTIDGFDISPKGKRAVFSARGDIFTVPAEHGAIRNLTDDSGSRQVSPSWSPDGNSIAWFSDDSGEYRLVIANQFGVRSSEIKLAERGFYHHLQWSPDGKRLVFTDQNQQLWIANAENASTRIIDQNLATHPEPELMASWSPDSNWVAYTTQNEAMFRELSIYSVTQRTSYPVTNGMAEVRSPAWDDKGRLFFLASTDYGPHAAWLDMSTIAFTPKYHLYYALLNLNAEIPLIEKSDDEDGDSKSEDSESDMKQDDEGDESSAKTDSTITIDFEGLVSRTMPLSKSTGHYSHLKSDNNGHLFYLADYTDSSGESKSELMRMSLEDGKVTSIANDVQQYDLSANGETVLVQSRANWSMFAAGGESGPDNKVLDMALRKKVTLAEEWQQIFREAWRFQRDYLYVDNFHGADWDKVYEVYQPLVASIRHPADLTYLLDTLGSEVAIGHSYTRFGELPSTDSNQIGLLGAAFELNDNGAKFTKVYNGNSYFPAQNMQAPLAKYAHLISEGDYLLSVNGKEISADANFYQHFEGTLGKLTTIVVGKSESEQANQTFHVIPIANDTALKRNDWVEQNRRYVDEKSDGKLAYVWIPDTADNGYTSFNRYFFAQSDKLGVVLDERFNHGGFIANYIIDVLRRELNGFFNNPFEQNKPMTSPGSGIWGNQVMLINEVSGSGGDMLPYMFRHYNLGPLIGKRTWGGLVGIWGVPSLIDGGYITAPRSGFYDLNGEWKVENEGVAPDIEVEQWTKLTAQGQDPQLDKAIEEGLKNIDANAGRILTQPEPPVRVPNK